MAYSLIDDQSHSDPAHLQAGLAADGLYYRAESYIGCFGTDGHIPREWAAGHDPTGELAGRLVAAGLWTVTDTGWESVDYLVRNPSRDEVAALRAKRSKAGKAGARRRWQQKNTEPSPPPGPPPPPVESANPAVDALLNDVSAILREPQTAGREVIFDPDDIGVKMVVLRYEQRDREQHIAAAREAARMLADPAFGQRVASRVLSLAWERLDAGAIKSKAAGVREAAKPSDRETRSAARARRRSLAGSSLMTSTVDATAEEIR